MMNLDDHNTLDRYVDQLMTVQSQFAIDHMIVRLWAGDPSLWYPAADTQDRIRQRLGWLHLPDDKNAIAQWAAAVKTRSERVIYVAGGAAADLARLWRDLAGPDAATSFDLLDASDLDRVSAMLHVLDWDRTAVVLAAPPDNAPEAAALIAAVHAAWRGALPESAGSLTILAPPDALVLDRFAEAPPHVIDLPSDVGSRFAALGSLGLVPAALAGWNVDQIVDHAQAMRLACMNEDLTENPGAQLGIALGVLAQQGHDLLVLHVSPSLAPLATWIASFVAGSLSKHGRGFVPLVNQASLAEMVNDRINVVIRWRHDLAPTIGNAQPFLDITLDDHADVAGLIVCWQVAVTTAALIIGLNPFDEPDTDALHAYMQRLIGRDEPITIAVADAAALDRLLLVANRAHFVAIVLFGDVDDRVSRVVERLTERIDAPILVIQPAREYAYATQLLHAGRSNGAVVAVVNGSPKNAVERARIEAHLYAWQRMKRDLLVIDASTIV